MNSSKQNSDHTVNKAEKLRITVDPLLPIVVIFLAWILSDRYYPQIMFSPSVATYWAMGVVSSLFLTLSIFFHEYGHALAAYRLNLPLERIHLYLFGGMAELKQRPRHPKEEMFIAFSGPLASALFAFLSWVFSVSLKPVLMEAYYVFQFVFYMNLMLSFFNLLPIFPLDGGRMLRSLLWYFKNSFFTASRLTYYVSIGIIILMMSTAFFLFFFDNLFIAFWLVLLSGYLWCTAYRGREELVYLPKMDDLIYRINPGQTPEAIIRQINRMNKNYLPNMVIPIIKGKNLEAVILGKEVKKRYKKGEKIEEMGQPVEKGLFVDIAEKETYRYDVKMKAAFLPVVNKGKFLGISDANELRFWLLHHKKRSIFPELLIPDTHKKHE